MENEIKPKEKDSETIQKLSELLEAIKKQNIEAVKTAIQNHADLDAVSESGMPPLILAAQTRNYDIVKLLLVNGAKTSARRKNSDGDATALHLAAANGDINIGEILLAYGADVEAKIMPSEATALLVAAQSGYLEFVKLLVANGANINATSAMGNRAINHAMGLEGGPYIDIMGFLLKEGSDINAKNKRGYTLLMHAAEFGLVDVVKFLLANGADLFATNNENKSVLMCAEKHNEVKKILNREIHRVLELFEAAEVANIEYAEILLKLGVNINAKNENGDTPLIVAARNNHLDFVEMLIRKGADLHVRNKAGFNALAEADLKNNLKVMQYLMECRLQCSLNLNAVMSDLNIVDQIELKSQPVSYPVLPEKFSPSAPADFVNQEYKQTEGVTTPKKALSLTNEEFKKVASPPAPAGLSSHGVFALNKIDIKAKINMEKNKNKFKKKKTSNNNRRIIQA